MSLLSKLFKKKTVRQKDNYRQQQDPSKPEDLPIERNYKNSISRLKEELGDSTDFATREFTLQKYKGVAVYIDGLVNNQMISDFFMDSLLKIQDEIITDSFQYMVDKATSLGNIQIIHSWDQVYEGLLSGNTIIFVDGFTKAINIETKGWDKRAITEPSTQLSIRGPKDSFVESIRTNTALIRRRIKSPNLWLETMRIGTVTQTDIGIMFVKGIADDKIVKEVKKRLTQIKIDSIIDSGYIEQLIEDQTWTSFPTTYHSERPDVICSQLLEGRVAVLVDGSPFVLTAPAVFIQFFQAPDDYYARFDISTGIRLLRLLAFFIALVGPALYIAVTTFHQEMVPTTMIIALAAQRENVPFPAFIEALIMEITFEILREAGLRLPRSVGQAVSIVGALVIGQSAVQAGFVSPVMVIVVAITAIANFSTPTFAMAISARLLRFVLMGLATMLGFYGIMIGIMFMTIHLCSLRSFGVPYMSPIAPLNLKGQQDVLIRFPVWAMKNRPPLISEGNLRRTGTNQKPAPYKQKENDSNNQQKGDQS
jgi:spore germination protein KA